MAGLAAMSPTHIVLLLGAGLGAGITNAIAGGGSLITFPALLAVGLPAKVANFTNSVGVCPGYVASVYGSRHDLPPGPTKLGTLPTAALGAMVGCLLLVATPAATFQLIVPFFVLGAALVLAFQERLRRMVGHSLHLPESGCHRQHGGRHRQPALAGRRQTVALHAMVGVGAVYGGYFGAALGVMLVAGLGLVLDETLGRINARKNLLSMVIGLVTVVVFTLVGQLDWVVVAMFTPATVAGGYLGARLARQLSPSVLRMVIVAFGLIVGGYLLVRTVR